MHSGEISRFDHVFKRILSAQIFTGKYFKKNKISKQIIRWVTLLLDEYIGFYFYILCINNLLKILSYV